MLSWPAVSERGSSFPGWFLTGPSQSRLSGGGSRGWKCGNRSEAPREPRARSDPSSALPSAPARAVLSHRLPEGPSAAQSSQCCLLRAPL